MKRGRPSVPVMGTSASLDQVRSVGLSRVDWLATNRVTRPKSQTKSTVSDDIIDDGLQKISETQEEYRDRLRRTVANIVLNTVTRTIKGKL